MPGIRANGTAFDVADGTSVEDFIRSRQLDPRYVIVERNGEPLERALYAGTVLAEGDRLELVRAVAGGGDDTRARLARARLYLVCDGGRSAGLLDDVLAAGVDVIQLREKAAEAGEVLRMAEPFRDAAERHGKLFIVNDRPDVALAAGADGVHLGQGDLPAAVARHILGPDALIGLSTHAPAEFDAAPPEADYLCCGPVWETPTKPGRPAAGLALLRHAAASGERRPWFAIGGIDPGNLPEVTAAGATRIVVVRALTGASDATEAVRALLSELPA